MNHIYLNVLLKGDINLSLMKHRVGETEIQKNEYKINLEELYSSISRGCKEIKEGIDRSVLIIGDTGTGKSTLINLLLGNKFLSEKAGLKKYILNLLPGQDGPKIGSRTISQTAIPYPWIDNDRTVYWDCPGFEDTRSVEQDIANGFFIKKIFETSHEVKLLLVIEQSQLEGRAKSFLNMIKRLGDIFYDIDHVLSGLCLAVTKVDKNLCANDFATELDSILEEQSKLESFTEKERMFYEHARISERIGVFYKPEFDGEYNTENSQKSLETVIQRINYIRAPRVNTPISNNSKCHLYNLLEESEILAEELSDNFYERLELYLNKASDNSCLQSLDSLLTIKTFIKRITLAKEDLDRGIYKDYYKALGEVQTYTDIDYNIMPIIETIKFAKDILKQENNISRFTHKGFDKMELLLNSQITSQSNEVEKSHNAQIDRLIIDTRSYLVEIKNQEEPLYKLAEELEKIVLLESIDVIPSISSLQSILNFDYISLIIESHSQLLLLNRKLKEFGNDGINLSFNLKNRLCEILLASKEEIKTIDIGKLEKRIVQDKQLLTDRQHEFEIQLNSKAHLIEGLGFEKNNLESKIGDLTSKLGFLLVEKQKLEDISREKENELKEKVSSQIIELTNVRNEINLLNNHANVIEKQSIEQKQSLEQLISEQKVSLEKLSMDKKHLEENTKKQVSELRDEKMFQVIEKVNLKNLLEAETKEKQKLNFELKNYSELEEKYHHQSVSLVKLEGMLQWKNCEVKHLEKQIDWLNEELSRKQLEIENKMKTICDLAKDSDNKSRLMEEEEKELTSYKERALKLKDRLISQVKSATFLHKKHLKLAAWLMQLMIQQEQWQRGNSRAAKKKALKSGSYKGMVHKVYGWTQNDDIQLQQYKDGLQTKKKELIEKIHFYYSVTKIEYIKEFFRKMEGYFGILFEASDQHGVLKL